MIGSRQHFLETANAIGARLCRDAIWHDGRCNWLGDSMEFVSNAWKVAHRAFGPGLYGGTSGIGLFLARLASFTNERMYQKAAEGGIRQALKEKDTLHAATRIALYTGQTGIAWAAINAGQSLGNREFVEHGIDIIERLLEEPIQKEALDIISGSAGAIPALIHLYQHLMPEDRVLDCAIRHGDHLIDTARKRDLGWSWNTLNLPPKEGQDDLTGYSHGSAGIGLAFLELHEVTGEPRFLVAAEQAFKYERHWFSPEHENWPDLRGLGEAGSHGEGELHYNSAWCHGAPGIGLSRIRAYELTGEEVYLKEAECALRTTIKGLSYVSHAGQGNFSLCHGHAGNAELPIYASQVLDNNEYLSLAENVGLKGTELFEHYKMPWPCGVQGGGETPGLMLGLAGIGYFYLRLYEPTTTPSVLIVRPGVKESIVHMPE